MSVLQFGMASVDLNLLVALDALLGEGSVAGAARRLGLSDSAMSRTLARLRDATGDALLVRAGRGMVPTPHAEALRERAQVLAREARDVLRPQPADLDLASLERTFTLRANDGFVEATGARLIAAAGLAPGVRLRFAPRPDKEMRALREGLIDLDIGVVGEALPEMRIQTLFRDRFVGVAHQDHPLLQTPVTPQLYAACGHVVTSRRGRAEGPVDEELAKLGLSRTIVAVVPSFPVALAIARDSDLVTQVPASLRSVIPLGLTAFPLPVTTAPITISQLWHPRYDADPAHRWLRGLVASVCREFSSAPADIPPPR